MTKRKTLETFIAEARAVHGSKYDYSKVEYHNTHGKVCIICPSHGEFWQTPHQHIINGNGCPKCGIEQAHSKTKKDTEWFIAKAMSIHGDKYGYSKVEYNGRKEKVCIICPKHGEIWQRPCDHLNGVGCPKCAHERIADMQRKDTETFIRQASILHDGKYDYSKVEYRDSQEKVRIICPNHGEFWQRPYDHLNGVGCPKCAHNVSKAEDEIYEYIHGLMPSEAIVRNSRGILDGGREIDLYIPSRSLAIEFDGLRWHSERFKTDKNYHLRKLEECNEKGIRLIQIFEDEWLERKDIVLSKIKHLLGVDNSQKIYARKCIIKPIDDKNIVREFLEKNHIQGYASSSVHIGGYYGGVLVGVMSFINEGNGKWNLSRFATANYARCVGLASKMFKHFVRRYDPTEVKSFADRRWTLSNYDNLYIKLGFRLEKTLSPDYRYVNGDKREHKFNYRKQILHRKYDVPLSMTEYEMTQQLGFYRIWDCGLFKYVWRKENGTTNP